MRYKAAVVLILLVVSAIAIVVVMPPIASEFHLEQDMTTEHGNHVTITVDGFSNCNFSVSFSEDPNLLYSLDLFLQQPAALGSVMDIVEDNDSVDFFAVYGDNQVVSDAHLVLNSDVSINLAINNAVNIEANVVYSNGVNLSGCRFDFYESTGKLTFEMDSTVVHTSDDLFYMRVGQGGETWPEELHIDVTLSSDIYGWIYLQAEEELTPNSVDGWVVVEEHACVNLDVYGTGWPPFDPQVKFRVRADVLSFSLSLI